MHTRERARLFGLSTHKKFGKYTVIFNKNGLTQLCVFNDLIAGFLEGVTNSTSLGYKTVISSESQTDENNVEAEKEYPTEIVHTTSVEIISSVPPKQSNVFAKNNGQNNGQKKIHDSYSDSESSTDSDNSDSSDPPPKPVQKKTVIRVTRKPTNIKTK